MADSYASRALLPEGLRDDLPPRGEHESVVIRRLLGVFASHGYDRVTPPILEFEESLIGGLGETRGREMFRVMDPQSHRMMALRADMTLQIERIATTRLAGEERPLRLAYAGPVVRVKGSQLRPSRQFYQAGIELIGSDHESADLEIALIAVEALQAVGVSSLSIDLTVPGLVPAVAAAHGLEGAALDKVRSALDAKDVAALSFLDETAGAVLKGLLAAAGPASEALAAMKALALPAPADAIVAALSSLVGRIEDRLPDQMVTIDPGEFHGFEYKTGIGFALFSRAARGELGRGGRYVAHHPDGVSEPAVGFSVYLDSLMQAVPAPDPIDKVYVPASAPDSEAAALRGEGWRTVRSFDAAAGDDVEARRLGCAYILKNGTVSPVA